MGKISIENASEGMTLETPVMESDRILVPAGIPLAERHLRLCRSWGITEIDVAGMDEDAVEIDFRAHVNPKLLEKAEAMTNEHFKLTNREHPAMRVLAEIQLRHRLEKCHG